MKKAACKFPITFLVGCSLFSPVLAAKEPLRLPPSSKWVASYEDDYCRLMRIFGDGDQKTLLSISRYGPGDTFKMAIGSKAVKFRRNIRKGIYFRFGPTEPEQAADFFKGSFGDKKMPAVFFRTDVRVRPFSQDELDAFENNDFQAMKKISISDQQYAEINTLSIGSRKNKPYLVLELGSMKKPFAALDACINELLTHWGIDIERHKKLSKSATLAMNPRSLPKSINYPSRMLTKGQPAIVQFRLSVNDIGTATACHIQRSTRPKEFDDAVCNGLMSKTRFHPALDSDGKPMASYWRSTVVFTIR